MAAAPSLKLLDACGVSPPPGSVTDITLPLTVFDVFWTGVPPIQRIFFYELNTTSAHFMDVLLPRIKHALSLSLQFFFSMAGHIHLSHADGNHEIRYVDGDSLPVTIAESDGDFHKLVQNNPKGAKEVRPYLPQLPLPSLLALQFTIFPAAGFSIGITMHHVVADGRSLAHFMKSWSSICKNNSDTSIIQPPFYDRTVLQEMEWRKTALLKQMADVALKNGAGDSENLLPKLPTPDLRATFVLSRADIELLRRRVLEQVKESERPFHCSTFVLTCSYVWICLIKSRGETAGDPTEHFAFAADARSRLQPPLPTQYFGNCLGGCYAGAKRSELVSEHGLLVASKAIRKGIQRLDEVGPMKGMETSISGSMELMEQRVVSVAGSPQFRMYEVDFGWGQPKKTEVTSIDITGAIYIGDGRDEGAIEVGLSLSETEMCSFSSLFQEGLDRLSL